LVFDEDIEDADLLSEAKELGATVVVHPGTASSQEGELVDRANQLGLALVATGASFTKF
jgi:AICAR transformylase/IMP cyclohydrolase PurH